MKRSKLDVFNKAAELKIKPLGYTHFKPTSTHFKPTGFGFPDDRGLSTGLTPSLEDMRIIMPYQEMHLARVERAKADAAAVIAAAAAAQKAEEDRAAALLVAAAEEKSKEEERKAERERRRKERKEKGHDEPRPNREENREKRLLKLVGAVVVKTMSKYRSRMDVDTFKKHAKEVRTAPLSASVPREVAHA